MKPLYKAAASLLVSLCAMHALTAQAAPVRRTLTPDDFYRVQDVSDPQVSPDGQWVAYVVTTNDREPDEARSAIWMVSWDGKERLALTAAADGTGKPRWSPDGRYLAFMSTPPGADKPQIMLLDRRGGDARQLTGVSGDIGEYAWSPDGRRLAFAMQEGDPGAAPKPMVIDALHFKQDEEGYLRSAHARHLYLFDVENKHTEPLTNDPAYNEDLPAWSPDGRRIAFIRTREQGADPDGREDIDVIESAIGATPRRIARPYAPNAQKLAWSPDATLIAYLQGIEPRFYAYMQDRLAVVPAGGGAPRALTDKLDRAVTSFAFAADSASIMVSVEDDGGAYPARVDLRGGAITGEGATGPFVVSALSSAAGHTVLLEANDGALAEVYALEAGQLRKLTAQNDAFLAEVQLGAVEDIRFKSKDGTEIRGLVVTPPSYVPGRKYPTILWIHGGPNGPDEHALALDGYQFEPQMFAAKGYVVLRVNYRGGSGRGRAFAQAIAADWGHKEVEDLLAGVDYLVARGIADKGRLGVGGWSYGGILTDYTIASDRRFKVAISGAGSGNQLSTYGSDEYVLQYNNELGPPWSNTALWLKVSYPFFHADRIHTPTLFMGGEKDFNVPITGSEQMYQALRTLGVPAQLIVYPGQHHVFTRPSFLKDMAERMSAWLDRYLPPAR
ncbi:MAG TPA: S9 family peptidase [Steroidobacteraceae bacterium]|jgi:dipeptidyl aminopeptidase/acylaminoacyl peptidase